MTTIPVFQDYMQPILDVFRREQRVLSIEELDRYVIEMMQLSPEVNAVPHDAEKPDRSEVSYRIAWARTYLKKAGLLENPTRGNWAISANGTAAGAVDSYAISSEIAKGYTDDGIDEELTTDRVGEELARQLRALHDELATSGVFVDPEVAAGCYRRFREAFGPEVLAGLDGEALLLKMHGRKTKDSLMYWLEFKDDDEFLSRFGSIGGGSALKFGIYQAADTGQWMSGSSKKQTRLSLEEAVGVARRQRDQLVAAARVLSSLPTDTTLIDYSALQESLTKCAPEVAESSWGHKYLALHAPHILPPIHGTGYQEYQLYKLLKLPFPGRYENARYFAGIARQLEMSLLDLSITLHRRRDGGWHDYWRVETKVNTQSQWEKMRIGGFVAIGWEATGDLSAIPHDAKGRAEIRERIEKHEPSEATETTKAAKQIFHFVAKAQDRDVLLAMDGPRVLAIGQIVGDYTYQPGDGPIAHRRAVKWSHVGEWDLPQPEATGTAFGAIKKPLNIIETEARMLVIPEARPPGPVGPRPGDKPPIIDIPQPLSPLSGPVARINSVLHRKRQVILHGPPGTGKTFWAERAMEELAARAWFSQDVLDASKREELRRAGAIEMCSFHPAYGYEDFLEGYRPIELGGQLSFKLRDGIFKSLCARAAKNVTKPYFLIIDEINRGDIPRIFGELLTVLEREKRGKMITLPLSGETFSVPDNVYVIGTMNTADRSIALLDAALRRRFGFVELLPDSSTLKGVAVGGLPLGPWLDELNLRIVKHVGRDAKHLQVGHSYLLPSGSPVRELSRFVEILRDDILPLLEEYCYEDFDALERILGPSVVLRSKKRIDADLFAAENHGDLVAKLLAAFDGITAIREAVEADAEDSPDEEEQAEDVAAS